MKPLLVDVPLTHCWTVSVTGNLCHWLYSPVFFTIDAGFTQRTASAITAVDVEAGPSFRTTLPVVPAEKSICEPPFSDAHTPPVPDCWLTVYVVEPPLPVTVYGA